MKEQGIYYLIAALCMAGVLGAWYEGGVYKRMLRDLERMDKPENPFVKQLALKYLSYRRLDYDIHNMDAFIENQLYRCRLRFFRLARIQGMPGRMMLLCIMAGCVGVAVCVHEQLDVKIMMYHIVAGALGVAVIEWFELQFGSEAKRRMLVTSLKDYLENVLANHVSRSKGDSASGEDEAAATVDMPVKKKKVNAVSAAEKTAQKVAEQTMKDAAQEKLIAEVIREFFS